jgi:uncharacterized protein YkwD
MRSALLVCSAVIACCAILAWHPAEAAAGRAGLDHAERKVVRLINRIRARHGLRRLRASRALSRAASAHTSDMLRANFLGHGSSNGTPMPSRVRAYTRARWVGECVAVASRGRGTATRVVRMWMASPPHRAVLLSPRARRIGVGKRGGVMGGGQQAVYTADFASRR